MQQLRGAHSSVSPCRMAAVCDTTFTHGGKLVPSPWVCIPRIRNFNTSLHDALQSGHCPCSWLERDVFCITFKSIPLKFNEEASLIKTIILLCFQNVPVIIVLSLWLATTGYRNSISLSSEELSGGVYTYVHKCRFCYVQHIIICSKYDMII